MKVNIGNYPKKGKRKIKVSISKNDTYSLCHTLAVVILPSLKKYKSLEIGCPGSLCMDRPVEEGIKEWNDILEKMIYSFNEIENDYKDELKINGMTPQDWLDIHKMYKTRIQEGLDLFAKYYEALWW